MIPCGFKGIGQAREQGLSVVMDQRGLAMHEPRRTDDLSAECSAYRLMTEADAEDRQLSGKVSDGRY